MPKLIQQGQVIADAKNFMLRTFTINGRPEEGCKFTIPANCGFDINAEPHALLADDGKTVNGLMIFNSNWQPPAPYIEISAVFNPPPRGR